MIEISNGMREILSLTKVKKLQEDYSIVSFPVKKASSLLKVIDNPSPFFSYTLTDDEVSIIMRSTEWETSRKAFNGYREASPYHVITFDIVLDLSIVGFMSVVSTVLAEAGVSVYPVSTYLKDHILVRKADAGIAMNALNELIRSCRSW